MNAEKACSRKQRSLATRVAGTQIGFQYRESLLSPIRTPHTLSIVETIFFGEYYPAVLGIWDNEVYCLDILKDSSEETCGAFLKRLDASRVETVYVDPVDSLYNAANQYFPMAAIVVTDEAVQRYARNAMMDIIKTDGLLFYERT